MYLTNDEIDLYLPPLVIRHGAKRFVTARLQIDLQRFRFSGRNGENEFAVDAFTGDLEVLFLCSAVLHHERGLPRFDRTPEKWI